MEKPASLRRDAGFGIAAAFGDAVALGAFTSG